MIVITDSNEIISALIKSKGVVASIFNSKSNLQFVAPEYIIVEIRSHYRKIENLSDLNKRQLKLEFESLLSKIKVVSLKEIPRKHIFEAYEIVKDIDIDDLFFVALNRYTGYKIWTSDLKLIRGLELKGYQIHITTKELEGRLYKKG